MERPRADRRHSTRGLAPEARFGVRARLPRGTEQRASDDCLDSDERDQKTCRPFVDGLSAVDPASLEGAPTLLDVDTAGLPDDGVKHGEDAFGSVLRHMALPATTLALPLAAIIARVLKTSINEAMTQDHILMARVKGFSRARIVGRNALAPALTLAGVCWWC